MNKLIEEIMQSELSDEDKKTLILKVVNASHGINATVRPGYYLHTEKREDGEIEMELWFRNVDEDGQTMHGPTGYTKEQIFEFLKENLLQNQQTHRF